MTLLLLSHLNGRTKASVALKTANQTLQETLSPGNFTQGPQLQRRQDGSVRLLSFASPLVTKDHGMPVVSVAARLVVAAALLLVPTVAFITASPHGFVDSSCGADYTFTGFCRCELAVSLRVSAAPAA